MKKKLNIGLIGLGYWGPNILRVLLESEMVNFVTIFDIEREKVKNFSDKNQRIKPANTFKEIIGDETINAVIIATPTTTHAQLTSEALKSNKHVFCEKPISINSLEVLNIKEIASAADRIAMVGHIFEFNNIIRYLQKQIQSKKLGRIYYLDFIRNGLGPIREDVNVIADLASHDISIANFLLGGLPISASACASSFFGNSKEDIASINLQYLNQISVNINVSWIDPIKQRQIKIVSEKKMLLFDDVSLSDKLKIINTGKGYLDASGNFASFQHKIKDGDITIPNIEYKEPLAEEIKHFLECILMKKKPITDVENAFRVTLVMEAITQSLIQEGKRIFL